MGAIMQHVFSKGEPALHLGDLCFVVGPPECEEEDPYPHTWVRYVKDSAVRKVSESQLMIPHEKALAAGAFLPIANARRIILGMADRHAQIRKENRELYMSKKLIEREENAGS